MRKSIAQNQTEKLEKESANHKVLSEQSTALIFSNYWISDLGAEAHKYSKKMGYLKNEESNTGYFTSSAAFEAYQGDNPIYTAHFNASANGGAGRQLINGKKLARLVYKHLSKELENSNSDFDFVCLAAGGGSSFPFLLMMSFIYISLFGKVAIKNEEAFDFAAELDEEEFNVSPTLLATILVPSETKNPTEYSNYKIAMAELPATISYQLVKVDDISKNSKGENSQEENLIAVADQQARLKKIIWCMKELKSTQGGNIDKSELDSTLGQGGEIVANEGVGHTMIQALKNFEINYKLNNSRSSIVGASFILVKFLYPVTEYTQSMTDNETQVVRELATLATTTICPTVKASIVMGANVQQPTLLILAGGIPNETDRMSVAKSKSDTTSNKRREILTQDLSRVVSSNPLVELAKTTGKNVNSYNVYISKSDEAINASEMSNSEKDIILNYKNSK